MGGDELLKYFMKETDRRFQEMSGWMSKVDTKLEDLTAFKIEMIASARTTAFMVSAICGLVTLCASLALVYFTARPGK